MSSWTKAVKDADPPFLKLHKMTLKRLNAMLFSVYVTIIPQKSTAEERV